MAEGHKYWEIIALHLHESGWALECISYSDSNFDGWIACAEKDGRRHEVRAEDINTAFAELEASIREAR